MAYAQNTEVPIERTKAEIETTLRKYGADQFFSGWTENLIRLSFHVKDRYVRFEVKLPAKDEERFHRRKTGANSWNWKQRTSEDALKQWDIACRQRWRALLLVIKGKLEAVEAGIASFEQEFLANIVLPDNTLVGDRIMGAIDTAYKTGSMPALMAPGEGTSGNDA